MGDSWGSARLMSRERKLTGSLRPTGGHLHQPDPDEDRRDVCSPETATVAMLILRLRASISVALVPSRIETVVGNATRVKVARTGAALQAGRV